MISIDHFTQELLAQMGRAQTQGRINILISEDELCRSIPKGALGSTCCCDAMQAEMKLGDILLVDRTNSAGMKVRYVLPRASHAAS